MFIDKIWYSLCLHIEKFQSRGWVWNMKFEDFSQMQLWIKAYVGNCWLYDLPI